MAPPIEKLRLLVVIENAFARAVMIAAAEESEMFGVVFCAEDAHVALAEIWHGVQRQLLPDVVIVDLNLPMYDGAQLVAELRRHEEMRGLFVAIVAEQADEAGRVAAQNAGADCFGMYSTAAPEMTEVLREVGRRAIAESRLAIL